MSLPLTLILYIAIERRKSTFPGVSNSATLHCWGQFPCSIVQGFQYSILPIRLYIFEAVEKVEMGETKENRNRPCYCH